MIGLGIWKLCYCSTMNVTFNRGRPTRIRMQSGIPIATYLSDNKLTKNI